MGLEIHAQSFTSLAEVLEEVKASGGWPTTFVSGPSEGLPVHWHPHDLQVYVMEGETDFLDPVTGVRHPVRQGDRIAIPAGTLHAEGPVKDRVVYILAVPKPLARGEFLAMRDPASLATA
jgi:quercetin dioxygenase-like cupin family protein